MNVSRLISAALLVSLACGAAADDGAEVKDHLVSVYAQVAKLVKDKDAEALSGLLAKDATQEFQIQLIDHKIIERKTATLRMQGQLSMVKSFTSYANTVKSVNRIRNAAIANVVTTFSGTVLVNGKPHTFSGSEVSNDTWTLDIHGNWRLKFVKSLESKLSFDHRGLAPGTDQASVQMLFRA